MTPHVHTSAGDFAEWVFADNTQETSSSRNNSNYSVGSMVHVSGSLAAIDEVSDGSQKMSQPSIGISKQASVNEPPHQAKASSPTADFDSTFGLLQISSSPKPVSTKSTSVGESKQFDLDSAFNIPQAPQSACAQEKAMDREAGLADASIAAPAPGNTRGMSFVDVFGSADVFRPTNTKEDGLKMSPQMARLENAESPRAASSSDGHRRSVSVGMPESPTTRAKGVEFDSGEKSGSGESSNDSDAYEDAETSFRVKFSIRESAIKDNPDESKAALSRVTTLLRSAPSVRRGRNRRDVRTMYVPSSVPIASAIEMHGPQDASSSKDGADTLAQIQDPQSDDAAVQMREHASEPGVQDADVPITPTTPMPLRPDAADARQMEALGTDALPEAAREVPVATVTLPDIAAVVEADIAAAATAETITTEPSVEPGSRNKSEAEVAPAQTSEPSQILEPQVISAEHRTDDALPASIALAVDPEKFQVSEAVGALTPSFEVPSASQPSTQIQKGEVPGRRRAPPPPPPPLQSVQQQISLSPAPSAPAEAKAAPSPAENETPEQLQQQQLTSSKSVHRGRRAGVSTRPLPISMNVREIIDYEFAIVSKPGVGDALQFTYQVTGEVSMHIQDAINPLELAPLRVCIKRAEDGMELVANPSVAVLDTSFTATMADGRDWYRFVRPNLFAQVTGPKGIEVVVFKYMVKGADEHFRNMPLIVRQVESHTDGVYGLLVFYEPNTKGVFAGSTISELALMLSMSGKLTLDASRPAASWYQQHNRLLWTLDDVS
ncbi:hypothetical protein GGI22_005247, partial [Coemansia erecta]